MEDFDNLLKEVLRNRDARAAAKENDLRRYIGKHFREAIEERGLGSKDLIELTKISKKQIERALHKSLGGNLNLKSICLVADVLDLDLNIQIGKS